MATYPNVNDANKYARDVVSGKIPACKWVKLTCKEHLDDQKLSVKKNYPFYFDKLAAEACLLYTSPSPRDRG